MPRNTARRSDETPASAGPADASLLEAISEVQPDLLFVLDVGRRFIACHGGGQARLLLPLEAFIHRTVAEVLPANVARQTLEAIDEAHASGRVVRFVYSLELPARRWYEARVKAMTAGSSLVMVRDITAMRRLLESGRRSARRYRVLYDHSRDAVMMTTRDGLYDCNRAALKLFGAPSREVLESLHPGELSPERQPDGRLSREAAQAWLDEAFAEGSARFEWVHCRLDTGERFYCEVLLNAVELDGQTVVQAVLRDITERVRDRERLKSICQAVAEGIVVMTRRGEITEVNPAAERILGLSRDEILGRSPRDPRWRAIREDGSDFPGEEHPASVTLATGEPIRSFVHGVHLPDGTLRWISVSTEPLRGEDGVLAGVVASMADITELREVARQAEAASRAKSDFLANMSHEIRTPMSAILGYTELLAEQLPADDSPELDNPAQLLRAIRGNADHLLSVINDVLDVSKIEAGQMQVERLRFRPLEVVSQVLEMMRPRAQARGLSLSMALTGPIPATLHSDPTRLRQILVNLVGNALKFTDTGGVVVRVGCESDACTLLIEVQDTGIGMSVAHRERVARFEAFAQADSSMSRRYGGTGLGLRISSALAGLLGGGIEIESTPGQGSTFTLTLATGSLDGVEWVTSLDGQETTVPTETPPPTGTSPDTSGRSDQPIEGAVILLAEDGLDNQRLITHHLRRAGARVLLVDTGARAVAWVARGEPPVDLVVMDMQMPEMDGYAATRALRKAGHAVPVIALTAHALAGDREKCLAAGCDDYLSKPVSRRNLVAACQRQLARIGWPGTGSSTPVEGSGHEACP